MFTTIFFWTGYDRYCTKPAQSRMKSITLLLVQMMVMSSCLAVQRKSLMVEIYGENQQQAEQLVENGIGREDNENMNGVLYYESINVFNDHHTITRNGGQGNNDCYDVNGSG
uniref:Uncharacterized protein n=1 Tax=Nelumbo nucifera TaxID=4432 RepID=A0A822Y8B3_NELNU|nr:TPA_asm: hypothetical protein HUJ06_029980 [Nelumbo nucifera]